MVEWVVFLVEWVEDSKMNNFKLMSEILINEASKTETIADFRNNPKIVAIKKKAEIIRTKAELLRAKNQIQTAKLDNAKLKQKEVDHKAEVKTVDVKKPTDVDLSSGNPINEPQVQPQQPPTQVQPESIDEDVLEPIDTKNSINEEENDEELSKVPGEDDEEQQNDQKAGEETVAEVAGEKPQSKEEAEIARLQAQTREIQSRIGEYKSSGSDQGIIDPNTGIPVATDPNTGITLDSNIQSGAIDPNTGMPATIDPNTGIPIAQSQKPDPLKGFGDTTDPQAIQMGMMGGVSGMGGMGMPGQIDPMTGQPIETGPSKTPTAIGRLYVLKKIYYKLALLDKILTNSPDVELQEVAKITSEAFSIYRTVVQNLKTYKEQIDDIIVDYYMLVKDIAAFVEKHFKMKSI